MPGHWSSINGERSVVGSIWMPWFGTWVADVSLAGETVFTGPVILTAGSLTLSGSVFPRSGAYGGSREYRLVGGRAGWSTKIPAQSYALASGVPSSIVLGDAALACGEILGPVVSRFLGASYARFAGPASDTLTAVAPRWWIDNAGLTQTTTPRTPRVVTSDFTPTWRGGAAGIVEIATDDESPWQPGARFSHFLLGSQVLEVKAARHEWRSDGKSRISVVTA